MDIRKTLKRLVIAFGLVAASPNLAEANKACPPDVQNPFSALLQQYNETLALTKIAKERGCKNGWEKIPNNSDLAEIWRKNLQHSEAQCERRRADDLNMQSQIHGDITGLKTRLEQRHGCRLKGGIPAPEN